ncbi:MAG: T9SS type A sorting domain-containing protein [Prolixibacteraceae bacterium]|nr:T9SS type A sorting domain-containing protein [Prolixibacteraceae bacterium]
MNKKFFLIGLVLLFYSLQGISQQCSIDKKLINPTPVEYSYDNIIYRDYKISANCTKTIAEEFRYSLNGGAYKKFEVKVIDYLSSELIIETLELKKDTNLLTVLYNSCTTDIKFIFLRPTIESILVQQSGVSIAPLKDKNVFVIRDLADVQIDFKAVQKIVDVARRGNKAIDSLEYKIGNSIGNFTTMSGTDGRILIDKKNLVPGENIVYIRAKGKGLIATAPAEYSEVVKLSIFYIKFILPDNLTKGVCPLNGNINLGPYGEPNGGYYSGGGIVGKSVIFNPYGVEGKMPIQYNFLYQGNIITSSTQNITVEPEYDFSIVGSQIVCKNSPDNYYWISAPDTSNYSYQWMSNDIKLSGNHASVLINWSKVTPSQKVVVTATSKNGCSYKKELIVHVKDTLATKKSFPIFIDSEMKILACSDTSANIYRWIKVQGNVETQLGETSKPYYINAAGAKSGEIYYVETAYNKGFCFSRSYPCSFNNNWNIAKAAFIDLKPTELHGKENNIRCFVDASDICIASDMESRFTLNIVDINGRSIYQESFKNGTKINKNRFLSGLYIITVKSDTKLFVKSLIRL